MGRFLIQQIASLMLIALSAQTVAAQNPTLKTRTKEDREREFQANHRITLNVQVTDDNGKPVTDLEAKDFTIFDNHQPRKLATFHAIDGEALNDATEIVILLDAVNSTPQALEAGKTGIFKYLAQSHSALPYPTSFVLWSNGHLKATGATRDRNVVGKAFVSMTKNLHSNVCAPVNGSLAKASESGGPGAPGSGSHEADAASCLQVHFKDSLAVLDGIAQEQHHLGGRTILIWVGGEWPPLSDAEFAQLSPKARKSYFDEVVTILNDLRTSQVTLDALGIHDGASAGASVNQEAPSAEAASPSNTGPAALGLPMLAQQTGGRVIAKSSDITADLARLLDDADWYYALSFSPPPASSGVELRSVEVKVSRPGLQVRTITHYYTEP